MVHGSVMLLKHFKMLKEPGFESTSGFTALTVKSDLNCQNYFNVCSVLLS